MVRKNIIPKNIILVITVILLMLLIIFIVGRSYGFFTYVKKGEVVNVITINGISVNITNDDNALNLEEAEPLYDEDGMKLKAFTFTITNTSSRPLDYSIKVLNDTEKQNACLINEGTQNETTCPVLATTNIRYSYKLNNDNYSNPSNLGLDNNTIATGTIKKNQTLTYSVKMWIKSDATNDIQGNYFFGQLLIQGSEGVVTCDYDEGDYWEFNYLTQDQNGNPINGAVEEWTVPCDGTYKLEVWGASGGNDNSTYRGGKGGYSTGNIELEENTPLYIAVGGQGTTCNGPSCSTIGGFNGGGASSRTNVCENNAISTGGGGATHIALVGGTLSTIGYNSFVTQGNGLIVAGGGGSGFYCNSSNYSIGGYGGGLSGGNSVDIGAPHFSRNGGTSAIGGTQNSGYEFGLGGPPIKDEVGAGGGLYGGIGNFEGAGGGSGYIDGVTNGTTIAGNASMPTHDGTSTMTGNTGNGYAKITYLGD